jgi:hypothetical protein
LSSSSIRFYRFFDFVVELALTFERVFRGVATLGQLRAFVVESRSTFLDDLFFKSEVEQRAGRRDPLIVHDVELRFREGRRDLRPAPQLCDRSGPASNNRLNPKTKTANPDGRRVKVDELVS